MGANYTDEKWDPIYGYNNEKKGQEAIGDALTLGFGGFRANTARQEATRGLMGVPLPEYSDGQYVAPEYAGDFNPEAFAMPEEAKYSLAQDSAEGRAAQLEALSRMAEQSDQSVGSQQALDRLQAQKDAAQFSNAREGLIRQDAMRRGQIGGAADMIMRAQAAQMAADRNQEGGLQSAQQAALQRLAGTQAQAGLAGQLRGQDQALAFRNADIINQFNMANTNARNATRAQNTATHNAAGLRNLDARQGILGGRADTANQNLNRSDTIADRRFGNAMDKQKAIANAMTGQAQGQEKQGDQWQSGAQMLMKFFGAAGGGK